MSVSTFWLEKFKTKLKTLGGFETLQELKNHYFFKVATHSAIFLISAFGTLGRPIIGV